MPTAQDAPMREPPIIILVPSGFQVRKGKASASRRNNTGTEPLSSATAMPRLDGFDNRIACVCPEPELADAADASAKLPSARQAALPVTPRGDQIAHCENW